jgi:hypothetical protein
MVVESASIEGFKYIDDPIEGQEGCVIVSMMIHCMLITDHARHEYLQREEPQADFEENDLASWEGMVLAMQYASSEVLQILISKLPAELTAYGIQSLPDKNLQAHARHKLMSVN